MFGMTDSCKKLTGVGIYSASGSEKRAFVFVLIFLVRVQRLE
jgi:hypothetical protein